MNLTKTEEQLMEMIWKQDKVFLKDLIDSYPEPKPATTTVATLLKRMQDKGFVAYTLFGNSRQYYPLVKKSDYFSKHVNGIIKNFFDNSALQFASFFTKSTNLTTSELEDLRKIVDQEIKKKEKMPTYFIKVILCSALFFGVYKLLFENEKMFHFNRIYLLLSIIFSFIVPFVTIQTHSQILPSTETSILSLKILNTYSSTQTSVPVNGSNTLLFILLSIYVTITMLLLIRFGVNLKILFLRISNSLVIPYNNAKLVLINDNLIPHSFLNCIFINSEDYNNGKVEDEILLHELTHVRQKHSIDVLFIEIVQAIFWFNPVFILYRKAIQLNHEFLADDSVINIYNNTLSYQHLLIDKAGQRNSSLLTSQLSYSITKKKINHDDEINFPGKALCRQIVLVPLLVAAIFMFSTNIIAQETTNIVKPEQKEIQSTKEGVSLEMMDEYERIVNNNKLHVQYNYMNPPVVSNADRNRLETIFFAMSKEQQAKQTVTFEQPVPSLENKLTEEQFVSFKNPKKYAITINDKKVDNSELNKYKPSDFAHFSIIYLAKTNRNYGKHLPLDLYLMTKEYYKAYAEKFLVDHTEPIMITKFFLKKGGQK